MHSFVVTPSWKRHASHRTVYTVDCIAYTADEGRVDTLYPPPKRTGAGGAPAGRQCDGYGRPGGVDHDHARG
jgi:hypothetical protein